MISFILGIQLLVAGLQPQRDEPPGSPPDSDLVTTRIERRIVKIFDFDERKLGNFEDLPMNWRRLTGPGYSRYLEPRFDEEVGHTAPPSFGLSIKGGSVGAQYLAKDLPIKPESDYRVVAWIRTSHLTYARAYITAYYYDHAFRKMAETERRSRAIGGGDENEAWTQVVVDLPGGLQQAAWIGLTCRVEQAGDRQPTTDDPRPINHSDVLGTAWFDDLMVIRLPQVSLAVGEPDHVFLEDQPVEFTARVADPDGLGLVATLDLLDAEGRVEQSHNVPVIKPADQPVRTVIRGLPPGLYTARLAVSVDAQLIAQQCRTFVRVSGGSGGSTGGAGQKTPGGIEDQTVAPAKPGRSGFGVLLAEAPPLSSGVIGGLLSAGGIQALKVPLWCDATSDASIVQGDPRIDRLLRVARDLGIPVAGVLSAPPRSLAASENAPKRTLLEVLSSTPDEWRPHLALLLARHGEQIASWQIGDDEGAADQIETRLLAGAVRNVRSELLPLIGSPTLAAPAALNMQADVRAQPVDILSITVPWSVPAHRLAELLRRTDIAAFPQRWVTLEAPPRDRYTRRARLIEYARRLVVARGSGAEYVFVPQPWNVGPDGDGLTPDEEFILLRTIARTLGPLTPAGTLWLGHGVQAHLFADDANGRTFIAAWTDADEIRPRVVPIDLGSELKQIDLWGNDRALAPENGESTATLDALPVIIGPIRAWRARMLSSFTVENPTLEVAVGESERKLELTNPMPRALRGILRLEAPAGWVVRPAKIDVDLEPGASLAQAINVRIPSNQAVGDYTLTGRLTFDLPEEGHLTVRAPLYVRCPGLDVGVLTDTEGSGLRVIQRITNLTGETISLRTFLVARGEPIDAQTIAHLAAGQTAVREYRIEDARSLAGGFLRVSAQQIGGRMQSHQVISLPSR